MSRYLNADELHSQGLVAARYINWEPTPLNDNFRLEVEVKPLITFPAADVVEVVRCKECKWFGDIGCAIRIVDDSDRPSENDFCSFAERKDNG